MPENSGGDDQQSIEIDTNFAVHDSENENNNNSNYTFEKSLIFFVMANE